MAIEANTMSRMYSQIVQGIPKEKSTLVVDAEHDEFWDKVAAEVEQMRIDNPDVMFEIPSELPEADDLTGFMPDGEWPERPAPGAAPAAPAGGALPPGAQPPATGETPAGVPPVDGEVAEGDDPVMDALRALQAGTMSVEQVAAMVRKPGEEPAVEPEGDEPDPEAEEEPEEPAEGTDDDPDADTEDDEDDETKPKGGKPKKGVNPFPPKK